MTLNIWNLSGPWRERRAEILAWLALLDPDVVCLQEVVETEDGRNQARWLAEHAATGYSVAYGSAPAIEGYRVGNAILSRWPIEEDSVTPLPSVPGRDNVERLVVHARTNRFDVYCTHLAWLLDVGHIRERQVRALVEVVRSSAHPLAPVPPIVAGDFNAEPDSTEIRYLTGLASIDGDSVAMLDAWRCAGNGGPGWTWDNRNPFAAADREPDKRIDYVLLGWRMGSGAWIRSAQVVCDRALTGTYATDHYGVFAEVVSGRME